MAKKSKQKLTNSSPGKDKVNRKRAEMRELRDHNRHNKDSKHWYEWTDEEHKKKHLQRGQYWLCYKCKDVYKAKIDNEDLMKSLLAAEGLIPCFPTLILEDLDDSPSLRIATRKFRKIIRQLAKANGLDRDIIYYARRDIRDLVSIERDLKHYLAQKYFYTP